MFDLSRLGLGLLGSIAIGYAAYRRGSLDRSGWLGAVIVGTLTFGFGGLAWGLTLITFFVTSTLLSRYKEAIKEQRAGDKFAKGGRRDLAQTLANGGVGALLALLYGLSGEPPALAALFLGVMATVTADTWATELGVLAAQPPRLVTTLQIVPPGTSGGITLVGTAAAAAGGLTIGVAMLLFSMLGSTAPGPGAWMLTAGLLGGLSGAMADSLLGATVQGLYHTSTGDETERPRARDGTAHQLLRGWRWMTNDLVNLLSSLIGGLVALALFRLLG